MKQLDDRNTLSKKNFYIFFILICLSLFWDEFFYFYFILAPLLYFSFIKKYSKEFFVVFARTIIFFSFVTFYLVPHLSKAPFNFLEYALFSNTRLSSGYFPSFWQNIFSLMTAYMSPITANLTASSTFVLKDIFNLSLVPVSITTVIFAAPLFILKNLINHERKILYVKCWAVVWVYFLFQELILSRINGRLYDGGFYWGIIFAFVFSFLFATWISLNDSKWWRYLSVGLAFNFCFAGHVHIIQGSTNHMNLNLPLYPKVAGLNMSKPGPYLYQDITSIWSKKNNPDEVKKLLQGKPQNMIWLYFESLKHR